MKLKNITIAALLGVITLSTSALFAQEIPSSKSILSVSKKVADWQIENYHNQEEFRAPHVDGRVKEPYHALAWQQGAFYTGLYEFSTVAKDGPKYVKWLKEIGEENHWKLHERIYHADDHTVGQFYVKLAKEFNNSYYYVPTQERFDCIMKGADNDKWHWTWCDALFMAPPAWLYISNITGNDAYLEYMDKQFHMTYDKLWSKKHQLFFRDLAYLTKTEQNGESLFWARGNGWVYGSLALMIDEMPEDWAGRDFYITLFQEMSETLKKIQRPDGTWSSGLLGGVEYYDTIETSGTSFFAYGLAWGIQNGLIDRETYEPTLLSAWDALVGAVREDGMLMYVQGVAAAPGGSSEKHSEVYGVGAFLAAGAEMYKYSEKYK